MRRMGKKKIMNKRKENKKEIKLIKEVNQERVRKLTGSKRLERVLKLSRVWRISMMMKKMS